MSQFVSGPDHYARNIQDGANAIARKATLTSPNGVKEPGIAVTIDRMPRLVIPTSDAIRIAHQIADAATEQNQH
ncbi:hypothetical protein [Microbacterium sp. WCS2018Hpa-9]|uniref:hypothetical protein n=1 Tax=Microbacterium sp. WCS2018Hpa-9 TaxID=3073635 RepID=UPI00288AC164|nr:hypothetical protein [Microbacterium sp. WCS2018Hpa-9]